MSKSIVPNKFTTLLPFSDYAPYSMNTTTGATAPSLTGFRAFSASTIDFIRFCQAIIAIYQQTKMLINVFGDAFNKMSNNKKDLMPCFTANIASLDSEPSLDNTISLPLSISAVNRKALEAIGMKNFKMNITLTKENIEKILSKVQDADSAGASDGVEIPASVVRVSQPALFSNLKVFFPKDIVKFCAGSCLVLICLREISYGLNGAGLLGEDVGRSIGQGIKSLVSDNAKNIANYVIPTILAYEAFKSIGKIFPTFSGAENEQHCSPEAKIIGDEMISTS